LLFHCSIFNFSLEPEHGGKRSKTPHRHTRRPAGRCAGVRGLRLFVENRDAEWDRFFELGLGTIKHADIVDFHRPNLEIVETETFEKGRMRKDVRWVTDRGELHEYYLDGWLQEYMIKSCDDYTTLAYAFADSEYTPIDNYYDELEKNLGDGGLTVGHLGWTKFECRRTPFQEIQVDFAGLERFSIDLMLGAPELLELIEVMNDEMMKVVECAAMTKAEHLKLWENLSVATMGPRLYREHLLPVYSRICGVLGAAGKKLHVHYDGKLSVIADDIASTYIFGIDSLTPAPEGDMTIAEARRAWPGRFLWINPCLGWYHLTDRELSRKIARTVTDAGESPFCLMISEDVPHDSGRTVPLVLETLDSIGGVERHSAGGAPPHGAEAVE